MALLPGERLARARVEAGLTLEDLARRVGLDAPLLGRLESGELPLAVGQALKLAKVLGLPKAALLHSSLPATVAPLAPSVLLRQMTHVAWLDDADRDALAEALSRARGFQELGPLVGHDDLANQFVPSPAPSEKPHLDGYRRAEVLRSQLLKSSGPLRNLQRLIEDRFGILVCRHAFADLAVAGAAVRSGHARVIVVADRSTRETTLRFTLAHELAHHLLDLEERDARADQADLERRDVVFERTPLEKRANAFAAMFLAPRAGVAEVLGSPGKAVGTDVALRMAQQVAERFGLGLIAAVRHLNDLRYYDQETADFLAGTVESLTVEGFEDDARFDGLERRAFFALARESISVGRARELIGSRVQEFISVGP